VIPGNGSGAIYRNPGTGYYYPFTTLIHPGTNGGFAYALEVTGDTRPDLLYLGGEGGGAPEGGAGENVLSGDAAFLSIEDNGDVVHHRTLLPPTEPSVFASVATFADYNDDGALDLYFCRMGRAGGPIHGDDGILGAPDLYLRRERGQFIDRTQEAGFTSDYASLAAMTVDFDDDGRVDLLVGSDKGTRPDELYLNTVNGFMEVGQELGFDTLTDAMGIDAGDIDGDGDLDILVTDNPPNVLWIRQDDGTWKDEAAERGLNVGPLPVGWGTGLHDFDHDGDLDIFVSNGIACENCAGEQENHLFLNDGTGHFKRQKPPGDSGLGVVENSRAAVFADIDRDGDLDILVSNLDAEPTLLRNDMADGNWLMLLLRHPQLNPPVGAKVQLEAGDTTLRRWVKGTPSYGGSSTRFIHFGLGEATEVTNVTVMWPDGHEQILGTVAAGQHLEITYDGPRTARTDLAPTPIANCAAVCSNINACNLLGAFDVASEEECQNDCEADAFEPYTGTCFATAACSELERCETFSGEDEPGRNTR